MTTVSHCGTRLIVTETPVDLLLHEHRLHRRALTLLEETAQRVERGGVFPAADVAILLMYFREFLEAVHQRRESEWFFPAAVMYGPDSAAEWVGRIVGEHEENKLLLRSLMMFWGPGDLLDEERTGFVQLVRTYVCRLRRHLDQEERRLFPVARLIPRAEQEAMGEQFAAIGTQRRTIAQWTREVERLERAIRR